MIKSSIVRGFIAVLIMAVAFFSCTPTLLPGNDKPGTEETPDGPDNPSNPDNPDNPDNPEKPKS